MPECPGTSVEPLGFVVSERVAVGIIVPQTGFQLVWLLYEPPDQVNAPAVAVEIGDQRGGKGSFFRVVNLKKPAKTQQVFPASAGSVFQRCVQRVRISAYVHGTYPAASVPAQVVFPPPGLLQAVLDMYPKSRPGLIGALEGQQAVSEPLPGDSDLIGKSAVLWWTSVFNAGPQVGDVSDMGPLKNADFRAEMTEVQFQVRFLRPVSGGEGKIRFPETGVFHKIVR